MYISATFERPNLWTLYLTADSRHALSLKQVHIALHRILGRVGNLPSSFLAAPATVLLMLHSVATLLRLIVLFGLAFVHRPTCVGQSPQRDAPVAGAMFYSSVQRSPPSTQERGRFRGRVRRV